MDDKVQIAGLLHEGEAIVGAKGEQVLHKGQGLRLARVVQNITITRRCAQHGTQPSAPKDQRTKSA